jgi:hypothetical protein
MKTKLFTGTLSEIRKYLKGLHYNNPDENTPDGSFYLGLGDNLVTDQPMVGRENAIKDLKTLLNNGPYVTTEFCLLHENTNEPAMKLKNVTITVAGVSGTGKGYISAAIYKALLSIGFDTSWVDEETTGESKMQTLKEVESIMHNNNGFNSLPFSTKNIKVEIKPEHLPSPDPEPNNVLKCIDAINAAKAAANVPEETPAFVQALPDELAPIFLQQPQFKPHPGVADGKDNLSSDIPTFQEVHNSPPDFELFSNEVKLVRFDSNSFSQEKISDFGIDSLGRAIISKDLREIVESDEDVSVYRLTPSLELHENLAELFSVYLTMTDKRMYTTRSRAMLDKGLDGLFVPENPPGCLAIVYCPNVINKYTISLHLKKNDALETITRLSDSFNFNYFTYMWITPRLSKIMSQVRELDFSKVITVVVTYGDGSGNSKQTIQVPESKENLIRLIITTNETDTVTITQTETEELMEESISVLAELDVSAIKLESTVPNVEDFLLTEKYRQTGRTTGMFKKIIELVTRVKNLHVVVVLRDESQVRHWTQQLSGLMCQIVPSVNRIHLVNMRSAKDSGLIFIRSDDKIEYGINVDYEGEITGTKGSPYTVFLEHDVLREQLIDIKKQLEFYSN